MNMHCIMFISGNERTCLVINASHQDGTSEKVGAFSYSIDT